MNKLKFLLRFTLSWAAFALLFANTANAQCTITAKSDGCVGVPVSFSATGPALAGADSIVWTFGNGKSFGQSVTNLWNNAVSGAPGNYTLKVYKNGVEVCNAAGNITIHENPVADFTLQSPTPQCFNGNSFVFSNNSSTPGGNPIIKFEFVYGDGGKVDGNGNPGTFGPYTYTPPNPAGGFFTPSLKIEDDKGCIAFVDKNALIQIRADLGADFVTPNPTNCLFTPVTLTNTSLIPQINVKSFKWEFGDGSPDNTTSWGSASHTYLKNGCFNARLIVESNDNCFDTAEKQAGCNVNPTLNVTVANGDVQCFGAQNFEFRHPVIQNASGFLWTFDDPPSGQFNTDNQNWTATHDFTSAGPFDVTFRVAISGCIFDTVYRVHVKGPGAGIETKPAPLIPPAQRYQCNITDTVYFPNISSYYFNDDSAYNDFYYTLDNTGAIFQFITPTTAHIDFDTIQLKPTTAKSFQTKTGRNVYQSAGGDTLAVGSDTIILNGAFVVKGINNSFLDGFHNNGKHVSRVWDFADNVAPQCTTDSRPIYPKLPQYRNTHFPGTLAPRNTYDANGKWVNCNFSYDSLPKHWYTPGEERCYQVRLTLRDTSSPDPNIQNSTASGNDPSPQTNDACESVATAPLALQGPNANGLRWEGIPCFGPANVYGFFYDFSRTGPSCDRQQFWIHLDSFADRSDNTPNVFDKWIPQAGTVVDRMFTPWPLATLGLPPNVGRVFWQYQPNGTYPSKIASPDGWVTIGFRVQNGIDPKTGQPCIDEVWYDSAYRYINANAAFKFNSDQNKPDSLYTFERTCSPNDVRVKRDSTFLPATNDFTYSSDSIGVEIWNWGDGEIEIDSFVRYNCDANLCYSYRIRYRISGNSAPVKIDSILTRIYDPVLGVSTFVDARDSTPDIVREHRYLRPNWNRVGHTIIPCQKLPFDSLGITVFRNSCCDNPPFENVRIAITGFLSFLNSDDSIVCRNTPIQFFDSARYYLEFPIPVPPFIIDDYDYWDKAKQVFLNDGVTPRPRPRPAPKDYEKLRWNFDDGTGWNASVPDNPVRSFPDPGIYDVKIEYVDSFACKQVETKRITVTGVSSNFTFNRALANCRPTVDFTDTSLMIDPCVLVNGTKCDDIVKWEWDFGDNKPNNQSQSILQNPSKIYTSFGDFDVVLKVTTRLGCVDSIVRTISLEGPRPQFEFAADSVGCVPFTLELRNTSINPTPSANWTYFWGDGQFLTTNSDSNVLHTYNTPGTYELFVLQEDVTPLGAGSCTALFPDSNFTNQQYRKYIVRVLPSRATDFTIGDSVLCVGDSTQFTSNSDAIYETFRWVWGDGAETNLDSAGGGTQLYHQFNSAGTYYVQFRPDYTPAPGDPTCKTSKVKRVFVRDVKADFECDTTNLPFVFFKNLSTNAQDILWDFGVNEGWVDGSTLSGFPDAAYNYGENQNDYTVRLFVRSPEGCEDSADCGFSYRFQVRIDPPNAFSPGSGDNFNELFDVIVENEEKYEISIFNRWGERVFFAEDKNKQWDGTHMDTGNDCPAGVYFVVIDYRLRGREEKRYRGSVTLFREK
jgi:gliding motility-associated-like protein